MTFEPHQSASPLTSTMEERVTLEELSEADKCKLCDELATLSSELLSQRDSLYESMKIQKIARVKKIKELLHGGPLGE